MIRITFRTRDRTLTGVHCKGHAGYAESGQDIVCSAVSAVLIGLVNEVKRYSEALYTMRSGYIDLYVEPTKATNILMEYALHTLKDIEAQYPENVKIIVE